MAGVEKLVNAEFNTVDTNLALWNIQPGLGTVMMDYSNRLARVWYAANADNWDMAKYQVGQMTEIQAVGEITRPSPFTPQPFNTCTRSGRSISGRRSADDS